MIKRAAFLLLVLVLLGVGDFTLRFFLPEGNGASINPSDPAHGDLYLPNRYGVMRPEARISVDSPVRPEPIEIQLNEHGMRMPPVDEKAAPGVRRVAVMGGSIAFGWLLPREQIFPVRLEEQLEAESGLDYEVLNFGAPGQSSFQGMRQYERLIHRFNPDLLVYTHGVRDTFEAPYSDAEYFSWLEEFGLVRKPGSPAALLDRFSGAGHWVLSRQQQNQFLKMQLRIQERKSKGEWKPRVSGDEFKLFSTAVVQHHASRGGKTVLARLNLLNFGLADELAEIARQLSLPLFDLRPLAESVGGMEERAARFELGLRSNGYKDAAGPGKSGLVLRVYAPPGISVPDAVFVVGDHPALGDGVPNKTRLYDDGTHGDEKAGDRVWSLEVLLDEPARLRYAFTNSGPEGVWTDHGLPFDIERKNRMVYFEVAPDELRAGRSLITTPAIYGRAPYESLLIPGHPELPGAVLHESIAGRLTRLILEASN